MRYAHRFITVADYQVVQYFDDGGSRVVDPHNEIEWIAQGNTPKKESGDRFIIVDGNTVYEDPNKATIIAAEKAEADAIIAKEVAKKASKEKIKVLEADVVKVTDFDGLKAAVLDLVKQLKILND